MPSKRTVPPSVRKMFPNVTSCVDSDSPIEIDVARGDVARGRKKEGDACAMARAICRQEAADGAIVGLSSSYIIKGNKAIRYITPTTVGREITSFDRHETFEPGTYHLSPVSKSRKLGKRIGTGPDKRNGQRSPHRLTHVETVNVRNFRRKAGA